MKKLEEARKKLVNRNARNERGSVTLFVLIAMLFFLTIGLIIFIANMNSSTSQQRDVKKIQSQYNNVGDLDKVYEEQKEKQVGTLVITVLDKQKEIYQSTTKNINAIWVGDDDASRLPLTVDIKWPDGIKSSAKKVEIEGILNNSDGQKTHIVIKENQISVNGSRVDLSDLDNYEINKDCDIKLTAIANENTSDEIKKSVNIRIDRTQPTITMSTGGTENTIWVDVDQNSEAVGVFEETVTTSDATSGVKNVKYFCSEDKYTLDQLEDLDDKLWEALSKTDTNNIKKTVKQDDKNEYEFYAYYRVEDNAGNVRYEKSKAYHVKYANYRIEKEGTANQYAMTLAESIGKCANSGSKIVAIQNVDDSSEATVSKNVTIDTNGKTLTMANTITVASGKTATFVDTAETKGKLQRTTGDLIINNGNVVVNDLTMSSNKYVINGGNNVTVNSGNLNSSDSSVIIATNITVNNGNIISQGRYGITSRAVCDIKGGKVEGAFMGVCPSNGTLKISGTAEIKGGNRGIGADAPWHSYTLEMTGGTVIGTADHGIYSTSENTNITITGGTITGGTNAINITGANSTVTIGDSTKTKITNSNELTPIITGTTGKGINITQATSTLNFYDGKIIGAQTTNVRGVNVAFAVADASKVNYRTEYGAHTEEVSGKYETTLVNSVLNVNSQNYYLNTTNNKTGAIEVTGTDLGTITYTSNDETIATVTKDTTNDKRATITGVKQGSTKIIVKDENSGKTIEINVVIDATAPVITIVPNNSAVTKNLNVTINVVEEGGSGLATNNSYQYYVSSSNTELIDGEWKNYTSGEAFSLGSGITASRYIWVKQISDKSTNKSAVTRDTYLISGEYVFDNTEPTVTFVPNGNTTYAKSQSSKVTVADVGTAGLDTSSLKYQWTQSTTAPAENTFTESFTSGSTLTKDTVTGDNWYLWIMAKDTLGNTRIIKSNPFYLDNTVPTYTEAKIENVTTTGYDVVVTNVNDANVGMGAVKVKTWTTANGEDDVKEVDAVKQSDNKTWKIHINVTDHSSQYGEYNTSIRLIDSLGNEDGRTLSKTTVPGVKLTFDKNGGNNPSQSEIIRGYDAPIGTLPTITRTGYDFVGWFTGKTDGTQISATTKTPEHDTTYYAHWNAHPYTIKFNKNSDSATGTMADLAMTYDVEKALTENAFEKTGYTFKEWTRNADGTGDKYADKASVKNLTDEKNGVITLYAQWTANNYTATADANGGSIAATTGWTGTGDSATKSVTFDSAYGTLPTVSRTGYTFKGWNGKNLFDEDGIILNIPDAQHENGYYIFDSKKAHETYTLNNLPLIKGQFKVNTQYTFSILGYTTGSENNNLRVRAYYKSGNTTYSDFNIKEEGLFTFTTEPNETIDKLIFSYLSNTTVYAKYIQLEEGGAATAYEPYYVTDNTKVTQDQDHTLNAVWQATPYTVTADANGGAIASTTGWTGTGTTATKSATYDSQYGTLPTPTRTGYTFKGWNGKNQFDESKYTRLEDFDSYNNRYYWATIQLKPNTTYKVSVKRYNNYDGKTGCLILAKVKSPGQDGYWTAISHVANPDTSNSNFQYTTSEDGYLYLGYYDCTQANLDTIWENTDVQIEEGTTATPYEPYYLTAETPVTTAKDHTIKAIWEANQYTIVYNGNGNTGGSTSSSSHTYDEEKTLTANGFSRTGYTFAGWSTSSSDVAKINETAEYTGSHPSDASSDYKDFKQYTISPTFATGDVYQLDVDVKGSGRLVNYFYGTTDYLRVASTYSSTTNIRGTSYDGYNTIPLTSDYKHYTVRFTLGSTGNGSVNKYLLFRAFKGCTAYIKNVKFFKVSSSSTAYSDQQPVKNLTTTANGNVNLYAIWTANNYTVKADANGGTIASTTGWTGTGATATKSVTYDSAYGTLPTVTKTGYTFKGWYKEEAYTNVVTDSTKVQTADNHTIYAKWEAKQYTISFNVNGGNGGQSSSVTATYDSAMPTISTTAPTKKGYTFMGWYDNSDYTAGTQYYTAEGTSARNWNKDANTTLYAGWQINQYILTVNPNGGTWNGKTTATTVTQDYNTTYNVANNPTREGYIFAGWRLLNGNGQTQNIEVDGNTKYFDESNNSQILKQYKITGTDSPKPDVYNSKNGTVTHTIVQDESSSTGYSLEIKTNGQAYPDAGGFINSNSSVAGTFYYHKIVAKVPIGYTLNIYSNLTGFNGSKYWLTDNAGTGEWKTYIYVQYTGYNGPFSTFGHVSVHGSNDTNVTWNLQESTVYKIANNLTELQATNVNYTFIDSNQTLVAVWVKNGVRMTFDKQGGSFGSNWTATYTDCQYDTAYANTKKAPYYISDSDFGIYRSGYTLDGWYTEPNGQGTKLFDANGQLIPNVSGYTDANRKWLYYTKSFTIYAKWVANSYTVTADANGGAIASTTGWTGTGNTATKSVTYDSAYGTLPTVSRQGYTFDGWYKESTFQNKVTADTIVKTASNHTLYAKWEANQYEVTANANGGSIAATTGWTDTGNTATKSVTYDSTYGTLPTVSRPGYTLNGWNGKNLLNTQFTSSDTKNGVTANINNGQITISGTNTNTNSDYGVLSIWNSLPQLEVGKQYTISLSKQVSGAYIQINYTKNNGSEASVSLVRTSNKSTFTVPDDYSEVRYWFIGIDKTATTINENFTIQLEEGGAATAYEPYYLTAQTPVTTAKAHTIKAVWSLKKLIINYNKNDGTTTKSTETLTYDGNMDDNYFAPDDSLQYRDNKVFSGWSFKADGSDGVRYPFKERVGETWFLNQVRDVAEKTINLYAYWSEANYGVSVSGNKSYYYLTLKEAVDNADASGSTITILKTCDDISAAFTIGKNLTINTNGKTVTMANTITVGASKTVTFTGNGKLQRTTGGLISNSGTVTVNGATLESKDNVINGGTVNVSTGTVNSTGKVSEDYPSGINTTTGNVTISGGNISGTYSGIRSGGTVTITGGTITGGKDGIIDNGGNNVITIGETSKTPASNTPVITGTTGDGINITKTTSTLNFYSGKIVGKTKATTRGVDTAFSVADQTKVNYTGGLGANGYGATTTTQDNMYVTTLVKPTLTLSPAENYLNITNNKEVTLTPGGTNYGTLSYTSSDPQIATVDSTGKVTAVKAGTVTITVTEANSGKTATCTVTVDVTKPIWTITVKSIT